MACIGVLLASADCGSWWLYKPTYRSKVCSMSSRLLNLCGDAIALGQDTGGLATGGYLGTHGRRGAGVLVQGHRHGLTLPGVDCRDSISSCRTALAMNSG